LATFFIFFRQPAVAYKPTDVSKQYKYIGDELSLCKNIIIIEQSDNKTFKLGILFETTI
jgi:hypothetical protein